MLTKRTSKNQITLPAALLEQLPDCEYFDATVESGSLVLRPVRIVPAADLEEIRSRMERIGVTEADIQEAVAWARRAAEASGRR